MTGGSPADRGDDAVAGTDIDIDIERDDDADSDAMLDDAVSVDADGDAGLDDAVGVDTGRGARAWKVLRSLQHYQASYLKGDILSGIIVAALTIPIAMGYAQVAGLPPVYGLYGSILPLIGYAILSSSPQLVFGVDAAAAAITGNVLMTAGIVAGSDEAIAMVPVLALLTGLILVVFSLLRAGRLVSFISSPVMGGFITGVALSIMVTQIPKICGMQLDMGETLIDNVGIIITGIAQTGIDGYALMLSVVSLAIILVLRKVAPKFPTPLVVMVVSVWLCHHFGWAGSWGISVLGDIEPGLPALTLPDLSVERFSVMLGYSFTIAVVIMAESLLAANTFSMRNHYRLDDNRELLAFGVGNILGAFVGVCPTSASVSRTAASDGFGGKTQLSSLIAAGLITVVVCFLTGFLHDMPTAVLAAIVFSALMTVVEGDMAKRLWKCERHEFWIFIFAMAGVMFVGIIFGVVLGVFLSLVVLLVHASNPPRGFLGTLEDKDGYFNMKRFPAARPLPGVVMYRFSATLSFANARVLTNEIEDAVRPDTKVVILDAAGIGSIDITAADRLAALSDTLTARGVGFFICEQIPAFNDQLVRFGLGALIEQGHTARTIEDALVSCGIGPYPDVSAEDFENIIIDHRSAYLGRAGDSVALGASEEVVTPPLTEGNVPPSTDK